MLYFCSASTRASCDSFAPSWAPLWRFTNTLLGVNRISHLCIPPFPAETDSERILQLWWNKILQAIRKIQRVVITISCVVDTAFRNLQGRVTNAIRVLSFCANKATKNWKLLINTGNEQILESLFRFLMLLRHMMKTMMSCDWLWLLFKTWELCTRTRLPQQPGTWTSVRKHGLFHGAPFVTRWIGSRCRWLCQITCKNVCALLGKRIQRYFLVAESVCTWFGNLWVHGEILFAKFPTVPWACGFAVVSWHVLPKWKAGHPLSCAHHLVDQETETFYAWENRTIDFLISYKQNVPK